MFLIALTMGCAEEPAVDGLAPEPADEVEEPEDPVEDRDEELARGERLFGEHCAGCHGEDGHGGTELAVVSSDDLVAQILEGNDTYPFMPAFADELSERQIADIADYVEIVLWDRS